MANNPTIIIGSLNDQELENSINKLCLHVQKATSMMTKNFDDSINHIEKRLKELGQINVNIGVAGSSGNAKATTRRKSEQQQIAEDTKAANVTLDQQAQVLQKIITETKQYSAEITKAADIVRHSKDWDRGMGYTNQEGGFTLWAENYAREGEKAASLEQQLVQLAEKRKMSEQEVLAIIQRQGDEERNQAQSLGDVTTTKVKKQFETYETLQQSMAHVLGLEQDQVRLVDRHWASTSAINKEIKQMQQTYARLNAEERDSEMGKALLLNLHMAEDALHRITVQMNAPTSLFETKMLPEKSLDDISYKIKRMQAYQNSLDITNTKGVQEYREVGRAIDDLSARQDKLMRGQRGLLQSNNALTRSFNYMKNRLAFMFTVGGTTQFVKQLAQVRGEYEMTERALGVLVDSAQRGTQIFQELSQMALVSPYTLIELSNAAKQLTAYDVAARDVVDTTRRLADISAAVGAPVERLTYALGQIKAYEYLNSRDARIFANAGIPLVKQLSQQYSELEGRIVSVGDVYDRIKKKAVSYNDVMGVLTRMTDEGGRFFDYQAKVADTLKIQLANLTLAWNNFLNEFGRSNQVMLTGPIKLLKQMFLSWKEINKAIWNVVVTFGALKAMQLVFLQFAQKINNEKVREIFLNDKLNASYERLGRSIKKVTSSPATWWAAVILILESVIASAIRAQKEVKEFNKTIADGAKESSKSLNDFLSQEVNVATKIRAASGTLAPEEGEKAWEAIREELENSSAAALALIPQLMQIEDVNKRVSRAFSMAESVQQTQEALGDLYDELEIRGMNWLKGQAGLAKSIEWFERANDNKDTWRFTERDVRKAKERAESEIAIFVKDASTLIRERLGEEGMKDATKVTEAVTRVIQGFYQQYPNLSKQARLDFEYVANQLFEKEFGVVWNKMANSFEFLFDSGTTAQQKFFEILKKNAKSAFADINDDILSLPANQKWYTPEQEQDILNAAKGLGEKWRAVFWDSVGSDINSPEWRRMIFAQFGTETRDAIQREFDKKFLSGPITEKTRGEYTQLRKEGEEETLAWEKRLADMEDDYNKKLEQNNHMLEDRENLDGKVVKQLEDQNGEYVGQLDAIKKVQETFNLRTHAQLEADKHAKKSEDILTDAIKREIQLVNDVQKRYEEYRKLGLSSTEALTAASKEYGNTLADINKNLKMFGLDTLSMNDLATKPLSEIRDFFQKQLQQALSVKDIKPEAIEALEKAITSFIADITKNDFQKVIDDFNAVFEVIKDSYDMAQEMKDNPELSDIFADMLGLSDEEVKKLPYEVDDVMQRIQSQIKKDFGKDVNLGQLLNMRDLNAWLATEDIKPDSGLADIITQAVKYINDIRRKEATDQIAEWNKLLEKYAEFEYKRTQIMKEAERDREVARKKNAGQDILNAIDKRERRELANLDFEQFQLSATWITATGDLATLADDALLTLINRLEEYKDKASDLDPKSIKRINDALRKMHKELRRGNPFRAIIETIDDAKARVEDYEITLNEISDEADKIWDKITGGTATSDDFIKLQQLDDAWKKVYEEMQKVGKVSPEALTSAINDSIAVARKATNDFKELADAIGGDNMAEAADHIERTIGVLEKAGEGAAAGAQIGGGWGALVGAIAGTLAGIVIKYADIISGNKQINDQLEYSKNLLGRIKLIYENIAAQADKSYGVMTSGLQGVQAEVKKWELEELERQLRLEQSRKAKNKDDDAILNLEGEIASLRREIDDLYDSSVNTMLGISDWGSQIESMVGAMIDAFRNGEDAMEAFGNKWDEMIDNMILKLIVSQYVQQAWDMLQNNLKAMEEDMTKDAKEAKAKSEDANQMFWDWAIQKGYAVETGNGYKTNILEREKMLQEWDAEQKAYIESRQKKAEADLKAAEEDFYRESIAYLKGEGRDFIKGYLDPLVDGLSNWYDYGENGTKQLSALQQGIQGITEDTAGALEAYMNGVSQQVYLHSDLLMQIRDTVQSFDLTLQAGIQGQILLQLQSSYLIMRSMETLMNNWTTADGMGIRVEMKN